MPGIIGYADVIDGWDEVGLPRTSVRRSRREARRSRRSDRRSGAISRSQRNHGPPTTEGTDLLASDQRIEPFGLGNTTVTTAGTFTLSAITQKPIQPLALVMGTSHATLGGELALVNDVKIGTASQLAGVSGVPASFFRADSTALGMVFTPVGSGVTITVTGVTLQDAVTVVAAMRVVSAMQ